MVVMLLLLKFGIIWLGFTIIVAATAWYLSRVIKPYFPDWWRRTIVDDDPAHGPAASRWYQH